MSQNAVAVAGVYGRSDVAPARIQWHPALGFAIATQLAVLVVSFILFPALGLSVAWRTAVPNALFLSLLLGVCAFYARSNRRRKAAAIDTLLATFLIVLFTNVVGAAQYAAVAIGLPLADPWLAAADAALGLDVPELTRWTSQHPVL